MRCVVSFSSGSCPEGASKASLANKATWDSAQSSDPSSCFLLHVASLTARCCASSCAETFAKLYVPQSDTLKGRVQRRLNTRQHLSNALKGRALEMPCSWEDFTADNWDNRIFKGGDAQADRPWTAPPAALEQLVCTLRSAFVDVSDVPIRRQHFQRSQLGRLSSHYCAALRLAWLIITGGRPEAGSPARPQPTSRTGAEFAAINPQRL